MNVDLLSILSTLAKADSFGVVSFDPQLAALKSFYFSGQPIVIFQHDNIIDVLGQCGDSKKEGD